MPLTRIRTHKEVGAKLTKDASFRVRLRPFTVPDEVFPLAESGSGEDDAPQHAHNPARSLFRRGHEGTLIALLESYVNPEAVLRGGVDNVLLPHRVAGRRIGSVRRGAESGGNDNGVRVNRSGSSAEKTACLVVVVGDARRT